MSTTRVVLVAALAAAAVAALPASAKAQPSVVDGNLAVRTVASGLVTPASIAFLGMNDLLVAEKNTGRVQRIVNGALQSTVLDLAVNNGSERGLLGMALHPNFPIDPGVYLYWTCRGAGPAQTECAATPVTGADRDAVRGPAARQHRRPLRLERVHAPVRPPHPQHPRLPGRRGPAGARQPRRRRDQLRAGRQALRPDRRRRTPRPAPEPPVRADRELPRTRRPGRPVRRPAAGQRASERRRPPAERGRLHPHRQPVLRGGSRDGRRGRGERAEGVRVRNPELVRLRLRPRLGGALGRRERRRLVHRDQPGRSRREPRLGPGRWGRSTASRSSRRSRRARDSSASSRCAGRRRTSRTRRRRRCARLFMLPGAHYSDPEFAWKFEVAPARDRLPQRPRARAAVREQPVRRRRPREPRGRTAVPVQAHRQPAEDRRRRPAARGSRRGQPRRSSKSPRARACSSAATSASAPTSKRGRTATCSSSRCRTARSTRSTAPADTQSGGGRRTTRRRPPAA